MLKYIMTKDVSYKGQLFRGRKIIGTEETLALIYPLIGKAIFVWGWRSKEQQDEMVKKGSSKTMDSNHCRGVAYDIWNWQECEAEMRKLGFINDLKPWDPGHFPFGGEDKARKNYPIILSLPKKLEEYKPSPKIALEYPKTPKAVNIPQTPQTTVQDDSVTPQSNPDKLTTQYLKQDEILQDIRDNITPTWQEKLYNFITNLIKIWKNR